MYVSANNGDAITTKVSKYLKLYEVYTITLAKIKTFKMKDIPKRKMISFLLFFCTKDTINAGAKHNKPIAPSPDVNAVISSLN